MSPEHLSCQLVGKGRCFTSDSFRWFQSTTASPLPLKPNGQSTGPTGGPLLKKQMLWNLHQCSATELKCHSWLWSCKGCQDRKVINDTLKIVKEGILFKWNLVTERVHHLMFQSVALREVFVKATARYNLLSESQVTILQVQSSA